MRPKSMRPMRLMSNSCKLFLLFLLMMAMPSLLIIRSHSPSQNIPQTLRKWRDILESLKLFCDACTPSEYGIEIESVINPRPRGLLNKSVGAGCAHSECNATINFFGIGIVFWAEGTHKMDATISWSVELGCVAAMIVETSLMSKTLRLGAIISELSLTQSRKRLGEVALLAVILTGCRILVVLVFCWVWVGLFLLNWICGTFVIAVVSAETLVIVAVIVAVIAEKAWGAVTSFKLEWWSLSAWSPVDAVVVGMNVCLKWAGLSFGRCKKLEVVIARPVFVNWIVLLGIFGLLQEACTPKTNALQLVEWKDTIHTRNMMSAKTFFGLFLPKFAICHSHQMLF